MNSKVIKFVAGGGKTTFAKETIQKRRNGIYLAFNNSVVDEIYGEGYLSKTIDSFIQSFVIPKFILLVPAIARGSTIEYIDVTSGWPQGINNINFDDDGNIFYKGSKTGFSLYMENNEIQKANCKYSGFIKYVFGKDKLNLTNKLRDELGRFIVIKYNRILVQLIKSRFDYVIIDEAQDLKETKELLAKTIYDNGIETYVLGDEYQNINNGGNWFEDLEATETKKYSYRSPENICSWIRDNLKIDIYGNNSNIGDVIQIAFKNIEKYDDGKRTLLYHSKAGKNEEVISKWSGSKFSIKTAKGKTICEDVVIIGSTLNIKEYYTALTRTTKNAYTTIKKNN